MFKKYIFHCLAGLFLGVAIVFGVVAYENAQEVNQLKQEVKTSNQLLEQIDELKGQLEEAQKVLFFLKGQNDFLVFKMNQFFARHCAYAMEFAYQRLFLSIKNGRKDCLYKHLRYEFALSVLNSGGWARLALPDEHLGIVRPLRGFGPPLKISRDGIGLKVEVVIELRS